MSDSCNWVDQNNISLCPWTCVHVIGASQHFLLQASSNPGIKLTSPLSRSVTELSESSLLPITIFNHQGIQGWPFLKKKRKSRERFNFLVLLDK